MSNHDGYTVYAVKDGVQVEGEWFERKREAMAAYREWPSRYPVADGYEVCVYRGEDLEMIESNWPRS